MHLNLFTVYKVEQTGFLKMLGFCEAFFSFSFGDRVYVAQGWSVSHYVGQTGFELRNPHASSFQMLRLNMCYHAG